MTNEENIYCEDNKYSIHTWSFKTCTSKMLNTEKWVLLNIPSKTPYFATQDKVKKPGPFN